MYIGYWKEVVYPKMKYLSLFIHANVIPNLNVFSQRKNWLFLNYIFILFNYYIFFYYY